MLLFLSIYSVMFRNYMSLLQWSASDCSVSDSSYFVKVYVKYYLTCRSNYDMLYLRQTYYDSRGMTERRQEFDQQ